MPLVKANGNDHFYDHIGPAGAPVLAFLGQAAEATRETTA
jgi:hypothetical protein